MNVMVMFTLASASTVAMVQYYKFKLQPHESMTVSVSVSLKSQNNNISLRPNVWPGSGLPGADNLILTTACSTVVMPFKATGTLSIYHGPMYGKITKRELHI